MSNDLGETKEGFAILVPSKDNFTCPIDVVGLQEINIDMPKEGLFDGLLTAFKKQFWNKEVRNKDVVPRKLEEKELIIDMINKKITEEKQLQKKDDKEAGSLQWDSSLSNNIWD